MEFLEGNRYSSGIYYIKNKSLRKIYPCNNMFECVCGKEIVVFKDGIDDFGEHLRYVCPFCGFKNKLKNPDIVLKEADVIKKINDLVDEYAPDIDQAIKIVTESEYKKKCFYCQSKFVSRTQLFKQHLNKIDLVQHQRFWIFSQL